MLQITPDHQRANQEIGRLTQQQFLDNTLTAEDFIKECQAICKPTTQLTQSIQMADYAMLADRISRGEVVFFPGSEIARGEVRGIPDYDR